MLMNRTRSYLIDSMCISIFETALHSYVPLNRKR